VTPVVVWSRLVGFNGRIEARARSAAGVLKPIQTVSSLSFDSLRPRVALDKSGNALFVWYSYISSKFRVEARARSAAGTLGTIQNVSAAGIDGDLPDIRGLANGNALIVWETKLGSGGILARIRSATGALGSIQTISSENVGRIQVGMQANGDTLLAWEGASDSSGSRHIKARVVRFASGALGAVQTLSANGASASTPAVAVKPNGGGVVA
jgi:hypothetical protein